MWLRQIYPPRIRWVFWPHFFYQIWVFLRFKQNFITFSLFSMFLLKLFWRKYIWRKFIWGNIIWRTSFGETSFGKTSLGRDWLCTTFPGFVRFYTGCASAMIFLNGRATKHTLAQLYYRSHCD